MNEPIFNRKQSFRVVAAFVIVGLVAATLPISASAPRAEQPMIKPTKAIGLLAVGAYGNPFVK